MRIVAVEHHHVGVSVRHLDDGGIAPYAGSQDDVGREVAESLLLAVRTDEGIVGWGEMNTGFGPGVDKALVEHWIEPGLIGADPRQVGAAMARLSAPYWPHIGRQALCSAAEMALWDIAARAQENSVAQLLGGPIRAEVPVALCLGITSEQQAADVAARALESGWGVLKTKIGLDADADLRRIRAIVDATDGQLRLRLDANQALDRLTALALVSRLQDAPVEYLEQPLPVGDVAGHRTLLERSTVPIAINEDAYLLGGVHRAIDEGSADAAVVELEATGGVRGMVELAVLAQAHSLPLAHHCSWDLGVKTAMMLQVISALPALSLAADSTHAMHLDDVVSAGLETENGRMRVPTGPGIGVEIDDEAVRRLTL